MGAKIVEVPILVGLLLVLSACVSESATNKQEKPLLERIDVFEEWYRFSYYNDLCGDSETGRLLRHLIRRKFESCPFSEAASKRFTKEMAGYDETEVPEMEKFYAASAEKSVIKQKMCDTMQVWTYMNLLFLAKRYEKRLITIDQIFPFPCDKPYHPIFGDE